MYKNTTYLHDHDFLVVNECF